MPDIYRALGDPSRRKILKMLKGEDKTQKEIVEAFNISQPAVKKHLNILLEEGMIQERTVGRFRYYHLQLNTLKLAYQEMLNDIGQLLEHQLVRLKNYVENGDEEK